MTSESKRAKMREYYQKNKDKRKLQMKNYYQKNKDNILEQRKEYYIDNIDDYYSVYLLEDYNYVGYTNSIKWRFTNHIKAGKDCTNYRVLYKTKSKKDALELEAFLHSMGYEGEKTYEWLKKRS